MRAPLGDPRRRGGEAARVWRPGTRAAPGPAPALVPADSLPAEARRGPGGASTLLFEDISAEVSEQADRDAAASALGMQSACAAALSAAKSADDLLPEVLRALCVGGRWDAAFYWQVDPASGRLHNTAQWRSPEIMIPRLTSHCQKHPLARGQELPGAAWEHACAVWLANLETVEESLRLMKAGDEGMRCAVAFPIPSDDGPRAVIELFGSTIRPTWRSS